MEGKVKVTARYKDQPQTCFECGLPGHERKDCQGNQTYAKKVMGTTTPPQPEPEQEKEPESDLISTPSSSLSEEETTDVEVRRKERKEKREKKGEEGKEEKQRSPH